MGFVLCITYEDIAYTDFPIKIDTVRKSSGRAHPLAFYTFALVKESLLIGSAPVLSIHMFNFGVLRQILYLKVSGAQSETS
jgi:hypothetical protein